MKIDRHEMLKYLKYKGQVIDDRLSELIDNVISDCERQIRPKFVWAVFDVTITDGGLMLVGSSIILSGNDIKKHFDKSRRCALMAVTAGQTADALILKYSKSDMEKAVLYDAAASTLAEGAAEECHNEIRRFAEKENLTVPSRFSPGYGDLPLSVQRDIIKTLSAERSIGLSATETDILLPHKSITAVAAIKERANND